MSTAIVAAGFALPSVAAADNREPAPQIQAPPAQADPPAPAERVAAIKKSFAESQARLRQYEWVETTVTSLKGEEKSRVLKRCYYGAEGGVQKVPLAAPPEAKAPRGIRGRIVEKKKEELADYMQEAAELVHRYLPPDPALIQKAKDAGNTSIRILEPGKRARVEFRNYLKPGDLFSVEIDLAVNKILGLSVATDLGGEKDVVTLDVRFAAFPDGTIYQSQVALVAQAKKVTVNIENAGYRKLEP
jgi:hypothetical protein